MTLVDAPPASRRLSPNALILIAVCVGLGAALVLLPGATGLLTFAFVAASWVLSVGIHEFGHAYVAYRAGDTTIIDKGYLTLDPLKYSDLSTTLVIPLIALALGGIGFPGGAVYLREDLMRTRGWRSLASLAGPLGTLVVLLAIAAGIGLMTRQGLAGTPLFNALALLSLLQASALILNLLPVPGLDGYGVLRPFMADGLRARLAPFERFGFLALFALIFFVPGASGLIFGPAIALARALGVPGPAMGAGWDAFHFWSPVGG
ncbi:MAG: site-2 protease family protein [Alphaproteobacteria bacterium]|nr:site-2 protease family protein [Alphaproteobacteria bacterium]